MLKKPHPWTCFYQLFLSQPVNGICRRGGRHKITRMSVPHGTVVAIIWNSILKVTSVPNDDDHCHHRHLKESLLHSLPGGLAPRCSWRLLNTSLRWGILTPLSGRLEIKHLNMKNQSVKHEKSRNRSLQQELCKACENKATGRPGTYSPQVTKLLADRTFRNLPSFPISSKLFLDLSSFILWWLQIKSWVQSKLDFQKHLLLSKTASPHPHVSTEGQFHLHTLWWNWVRCFLRCWTMRPQDRQSNWAVSSLNRDWASS